MCGLDRDRCDVAPSTEGVDAELIRELVGDALVVAIGEGAHNINEFHELTDHIFRILVRDLGFSAFVMESGFPEGLQVQAWLQGAPGDLDAVTRDGITYGFGECASVRRQLAWMRGCNEERANRLSFYGMDLAGCSTSPGAAVAACLARVPPQPGDDDLRRCSDLGGRAQAAARMDRLSRAERAELLGRLTQLAERVESIEDPVLERCAAALRAFVADNKGRRPTGWPREQFMAETVKWVLEREPRIVVSAHNAHLRRDGAVADAPSVGAQLASRLGAEYLAIATTYGAGPELRIRERSPRPYDWEVSRSRRVLSPEGVESLLEPLDAPTPIIDLRRAPTDLLATAAGIQVNGEIEPVADFACAYDAIIHLRRVSPVEGALERLRADLDSADWPAARDEPCESPRPR